MLWISKDILCGSHDTKHYAVFNTQAHLVWACIRFVYDFWGVTIIVYEVLLLHWTTVPMHSERWTFVAMF